MDDQPAANQTPSPDSSFTPNPVSTPPILQTATPPIPAKQSFLKRPKLLILAVIFLIIAAAIVAAVIIRRGQGKSQKTQAPEIKATEVKPKEIIKNKLPAIGKP